MDGHFYTRKGTINGAKFKYAGNMSVELSNGQTFSCVVLKISDLGKIRAIDKVNYELGSRPFLSWKDYGYTDYGIELMKQQNSIPWPVFWRNGKMTEEVQRSDIRHDVPQQFFQKFDTLTSRGGGYVILSPWVSHLFRFGMLFNKK